MTLRARNSYAETYQVVSSVVRSGPLAVLGVAATLLLAFLGVTHPHLLNPETAPYRHTLHLILLVLFPLLSVNLYWLSSGFSRWTV